jgi:hypothetical protein
MRTFLVVTLGLALLLFAIPGCGPAVPTSSLGIIKYEVPEIPGADEPFPIPRVKPLPTKQVDEKTPTPTSAEKR